MGGGDVRDLGWAEPSGQGDSWLDGGRGGEWNGVEGSAWIGLGV